MRRKMHELCYIQIRNSLNLKNPSAEPELRGCPCKNRPLDFRSKTEFLQIFSVRQLVHMINKNSNNLALSAVFQYFWRRFPKTIQNRRNRFVFESNLGVALKALKNYALTQIL